MALVMFSSSVVLMSLLSLADAEIFLGRSLPTLDLHSTDLLSQLEGTLDSERRSQVEDRARTIEPILSPSYKALPQDADGLLSAAGVRFLLHRYFVDRHGWYVAGIDNEGQAWNSSDSASMRALEGSRSVFEKPMETRGLSLHEVSLLASTLETYVQMEAVKRLHAAYDLVGADKNQHHISEAQSIATIVTYMVLYVLGLSHEVDLATYQEVSRNVTLYSGWPETKKWVKEVRKEVVDSLEVRNSFSSALKVVETIGDRYGRWQDAECIELKEKMLKMETPGTGRVPLSTFYKANLNGQWEFSESTEYLRKLGALDEFEPSRPQVMIANYVNSRANCVAASSYYNVCCISECESLLGHIEQKFGAPSAYPTEIADVVRELPSSTVDTPRTLSESLLSRLESISEHNGGKVPFHGRLFAQWLHHAYPRECPFPHLSGTTGPKYYDQDSDFAFDADVQHMTAVIFQAPKVKTVDELPWSEEEELFVTCSAGDASSPSADIEPVSRGRSARSLVRTLVFVAGLCAMLITLVRVLMPEKKELDPSQAKMFV